MKLIIVESPTKAKTLSKFLGGGFNIEATMGHIMDLPKSKLGIDFENDFKPEYVPVDKKKETVKKIKNQAKKAEEIYLATDPDREGEAIASHVEEILKKESKLKRDKLKRIVFHEITSSAVNEALEHPRVVDKHLVDAQTSRRVLDRLVGYRLSPLLWKKVRRGLSAGRVQSVALRLIVEREREIEKFKTQEYWEFFVTLKRLKSPEDLVVKLVKIDDKEAKIENKKIADKVVRDLNSSAYLVKNINKKEVKKRPYPPFTTSTMTQSAARTFYWPAKKTMSIAQRLYEEGLITYHRTDSTNLSQAAVFEVRKLIQDKYKDIYLPDKQVFYKTKSKLAQEAHEAIRPTDSDKDDLLEGFTNDEKKLYGLIWRRFVACQMREAVYDETSIDVSADIYLLRANGQIRKFDGWMKLYQKEARDRELPEVSIGEELRFVGIDPQQKFTEPPARYNEASLIKTLEKLGIGRPSTYAPTISTLGERRYVEKNDGRFEPTPVGVAVNDFLVPNFEAVMDYKFTADMEGDLDRIASGETQWVKVINDFWNPFSKKLEDVELTAKRVKIETEKTGKKCPECKEGEEVIRVGRFGKFLSCSRFPECKYTAPYIEKTDIKCPECKDGDVILRKTRKGRVFYGCSRYPACKWASWTKPSQK